MDNHTEDPNPPGAVVPKRPIVMGQRGAVYIPTAVRNLLNLEQGSMFQVSIEDGRIVLTPATMVTAASGTEKAVPRDQAWFHTPEHQAKEAETDADKAAGRITRYDNDEDFLASFDDGTTPKEA